MYDYVIVGAGSAGCAAAARLSEDPSVRVLLLEAGGRDSRREVRVPAAFSELFGTDADWAWFTEPQPKLDGRRLYWPRGKLWGGSSSVNAQMWVRGTAADYDGWAAQGNRGWGYDDLVPVFRRIEGRPADGAHDVGGPLRVEPQRDVSPATHRFVASCEAVGIRRSDNPNGVTNEGVAYTTVTQRRGRRWSTADAYLRPALARPNLDVVSHARATGLELDGARVTGVRFMREVGWGAPSGVAAVARADREVVLCAGAVQSPHLLLLSGIGPADQLRAVGIEPVVDLPGVGRNLQDHLAAGLVIGSRRADSLAGAGTLTHALQWLLARRGPLTSNVAEAHAFVRTDVALDAPDIELLFAPVPYLDHGQTPPPRHGYTIAAILQQPASRGSVSLRSSDPLASPRIDPAYLSHPDDLPALVRGVRRALDVVGVPPLADVLTDPIRPHRLPVDNAEIADGIRAWSETLYHPIGTCRMGVDDDAVVDPALRVRGVEGLRVADASVMPTIIRGHTHAPAVAIGERVRDLIHAPADPEDTS